MKTSSWISICLMAAVCAGADEASYVVRGNQLPTDFVANGYVQVVTPRTHEEVLVQVFTPRSPIGAGGVYGPMQRSPASEVPEGFTIPGSLRSKLNARLSAWEAATEVLKWVSIHVKLDEESGPQDAAEVLRRGSGRCSGMANATAALMLAAGFEARTISGLLVTDEGAVPHRWVACRLPDAGWVPTDPTLGLWVVTPNHLTFSDTVQDLPQVEIVKRTEDNLDRLPRWRGVPARPNVGTELVCKMVGDGAPKEALAILTGSGGDVRRTALAPEGRFEALMPGWWQLVVVADGRVIENRRLRLGPSQIHMFTVTVPQSGRKVEEGS